MSKNNGAVEGITSFDDSVAIQIDQSNKKINLEINASLYADEVYTTNYIRNLFKSIEQVCANCKNTLDAASSYFQKVDDISNGTPLPDIYEFTYDITNLEETVLSQTPPTAKSSGGSSSKAVKKASDTLHSSSGGSYHTSSANLTNISKNKFVGIQYNDVVYVAAACSTGYATILKDVGKQSTGDGLEYANLYANKVISTTDSNATLPVTFKFNNTNDALKTLAQGVADGSPAVVQVEGMNSPQYVTVVGIKKGADLNNLQQSDFLILDPITGNVNTLGNNGYNLFNNGNSTLSEYSINVFTSANKTSV